MYYPFIYNQVYFLKWMRPHLLLHQSSAKGEWKGLLTGPWGLETAPRQIEKGDYWPPIISHWLVSHLNIPILLIHAKVYALSPQVLRKFRWFSNVWFLIPFSFLTQTPQLLYSQQPLFMLNTCHKSPVLTKTRHWGVKTCF